MGKYIFQNFLNQEDDLDHQIEVIRNQWPEGKLITPREIKEHLDLYVIGQDQAKKALAVAMFNRELRSLSKQPAVIAMRGEMQIDKSNVLMLGPTGCGKTLLLQVLSKFAKVPLVIEDAPSFTATGYVGREIDELLGGLVDQAFELLANDPSYQPDATTNEISQDIKALVEHGIIYLDEVDKLHRKIGHNGVQVGTESVQEELLKLVEGKIVKVVPENRGGNNIKSSVLVHHPSIVIDEIDTTHILFVMGGSFGSLSDIIKKRLDTSSIGFTASVKKNKEEDTYNYLMDVSTEDLIEFGMLPEFLGRIPGRAILSHLHEDDLVKILTEPRNSIVGQFQHMFQIYGRDLVFTEEALYKVARLALKLETGARGLRAIIEKSLLDIQFESPDDPEGPIVVVDEDTILDK